MKYGTSGFRDHHKKILEISAKIGTAITLLSCYKQTAYGIMITGSHNHYNDNGVKIMDKNGNMVTLDVEEFLENYINKDNCECPKVECWDELANKMAHSKISGFIQKYMNNLIFIVKGNEFLIRHIDDVDIDNHYIQLLGQLTQIDSLDKTQPDEFLRSLNKSHALFVIEDYNTNKIVATGTILIETKLIHNNGKIGHIEDIVVNKSYRGFGLGKQMIDHLSKYAKNQGCYKCILDCSEENILFYEKCGYKLKGMQMSSYF
jgi:glucosamine-phosphate N-acetyltransferase